MKKSILAISSVLLAAAASLLVSNGASAASMKYECWTYVNGHPDKMTYVVANNKADAEEQAAVKFSNLLASWD